MTDNSVHLPEVVLFDVGGTLVESAAEPMTTVLARTLTPAMDPERLGQAFELVLGSGIKNSPHSVEEQWEEDYRQVLIAAEYAGDLDAAVEAMWRFWLEPRLMPDVVPVLRALVDTGHRLGVVSNWAPRLDDTLATIGIAGFFEVIVCSSLVGARKPNPEIFREAFSALGVTPERCIYVGDDVEIDIIGAHRVGMAAILVDREHSATRRSAPEGLDTVAYRVVRSLRDLVGQR